MQWWIRYRKLVPNKFARSPWNRSFLPHRVDDLERNARTFDRPATSPTRLQVAIQEEVKENFDDEVPSKPARSSACLAGYRSLMAAL